MHDRFRNKPGNQTNDYVPNKVKHIFPPCESCDAQTESKLSARGCGIYTKMEQDHSNGEILWGIRPINGCFGQRARRFPRRLSKERTDFRLSTRHKPPSPRPA